jgi:hypothetical protein
MLFGCSAPPGAIRAGVLLHTGEQSGRAGDRLHLRPIDCLWASDGRRIGQQ